LKLNRALKLPQGGISGFLPEIVCSSVASVQMTRVSLIRLGQRIKETLVRYLTSKELRDNLAQWGQTLSNADGHAHS